MDLAVNETHRLIAATNDTTTRVTCSYIIVNYDTTSVWLYVARIDGTDPTAFDKLIAALSALKRAVYIDYTFEFTVRLNADAVANMAPDEFYPQLTTQTSTLTSTATTADNAIAIPKVEFTVVKPGYSLAEDRTSISFGSLIGTPFGGDAGSVQARLGSFSQTTIYRYAAEEGVTVKAVYAGLVDVHDDAKVLKIYLQVADARFNTYNVRSTNVVVEAVGNSAARALSDVIPKASCNTPGSGASSCSVSLELPVAWFNPSSGVSTTLRYYINSAGTSTAVNLITLVLNARPNTITQSSPLQLTLSNDIAMVLPRTAVYPNDVVTVNMYGDIGSKITTFAFFFDLGPDATFQSQVVSNLYTAGAQPTSGARTFSTSGVLRDETGTSGLVQLMSLTIRISANAPSDALVNILCSIIEIKNIFGNFAIVRGSNIYPQPATMVDRFGSSAARAGVVFVSANRFTGALVFMPNGADLINDAILLQTSISKQLLIQPRCSSDRLSCNPNLQCTSGNLSVVIVDSACADIRFDPTTTAGAEKVEIAVSHSGSNVSVVPLRVWAPILPLQVEVKDVTLNAVRGWDGGAIDCAPRYQKSPVTIRVTYATEKMSLNVDVTDVYSGQLVIGNAAVAAYSVTDQLIMGLNPGVTTLAYVVNTKRLGETTVTVTNTLLVDVEKFELEIVTGLTLNGIPDFATAARFDTKLGSVQIQKNLTYEGQRVYVYAHVIFDDGSLQVLSTMNDNLLLKITDANIATIDNNAQELVLTGASGGGQILFVDLCPSKTCDPNCTRPIARSKYSLFVDIVQPDAVIILPVSAKLTYISTGLVRLQSGAISTSKALTIALLFGARSEDMTFDSRLRFDLSGSKGLFTIESRGGQPTIVPNETSAVAGSGVLRVYFSHVSVSRTFTVEMVTVLSSNLTALTYPYFRGPTTRLAPYDNTPLLQQARLEAILHLSDGSLRDISADSQRVFMAYENSLGLPNPTPSTLVTFTGQIVSRGPSAGIVHLYATFDNGKHISNGVILTVTNTRALLTSFTLSMNALVGFANQQTAYPFLVANFQDGSQYQTPLPGSTGPLAGMLVFATDLPEKGSVNETTGLVVLRANHYNVVTLTGTGILNSSLKATAAFAVNLNPEFGDVDIGTVNTIPLAPFPVNNSLISIPVRINTGNIFAKVVQFELFHDKDVFVFDSATSSYGPGSFLVNADPPGRVLFGGTIDTPIKGVSVEVAILKFRVNTAAAVTGLTELTGIVRTLANEGSADIGTPPNRGFVAGNVILQVSAVADIGRARRSTNLQRNRRSSRTACPTWTLGNPCVCAYRETGDTNGDCIFDLKDAYFVQLYMDGFFGTPGSVALPAFQASALDADLNTEVEYTDAFFLTRLAFEKGVFLNASSIRIITPSRRAESKCQLRILVQLLKPGDSPADGMRTSLFVDVEKAGATFATQWAANRVNSLYASQIAKGPDVFNGGLWRAEAIENGFYEISVFSAMLATQIGISFIAVTTTTGGDAESRVQPFLRYLDPRTTAQVNKNLNLDLSPQLIGATNVQAVLKPTGYNPFLLLNLSVLSGECFSTTLSTTGTSTVTSTVTSTDTTTITTTVTSTVSTTVTSATESDLTSNEIIISAVSGVVGGVAVAGVVGYAVYYGLSNVQYVKYIF